MTARKVKSTAMGEEYEGQDGSRWLLRVVDRQYPGKRAPVYYIDRHDGKRWEYASGLFATGRPGVFSLDLRDENGVRRLYTATMMDSGRGLVIEPGKARLAPCGSP